MNEILNGEKSSFDSIRFESSLLRIIHNLNIVGFEFVSTENKEKVLTIKLKKKLNSDLTKSIIHASQSLDQLSCAVYDDNFVRNDFDKVQVVVVDEEKLEFASAAIEIPIALQKVFNKISEKEFIEKIVFDFGTLPIKPIT